MAFNKNELILDRVRSLTTHDLETNELLFRLTSLEEVVDAIGSLITTLYRAKKATFSASNSLISLDLAAAQYGAKKEVGDTNATITDYAYEILTVEGKTESGSTTYSVPALKCGEKINKDSVKYIYSIEDNQIGTAYKAGSTASATEFVISDKGEITLPTGVTSGKIYVEYTYENTEAMKVTNRASEFPTACSMVIYAYFKDVCNENKVYSGKIICPKAKLNPEQVELALTSTGKHAFEFQMMKDYCAEEGEDELFSIVISA